MGKKLEGKKLAEIKNLIDLMVEGRDTAYGDQPNEDYGIQIKNEITKLLGDSMSNFSYKLEITVNIDNQDNEIDITVAAKPQNKKISSTNLQIGYDQSKATWTIISQAISQKGSDVKLPTNTVDNIVEKQGKSKSIANELCQTLQNAFNNFIAISK